MSDELAGLTVLVTRPSHQAGELAQRIEALGGEALRFPALEIEANDNRAEVAEQIGDIRQYDIAIFISVNAVSHGAAFLPSEEPRPRLAAIGPSTARALRDAGFGIDIKATRGFTSEALLREPALQDVDGKQIVIFRGSGGRAVLGRELEERGAKITYAEVYRRDRPEQLDPAIDARLAAGTIDVITATSAETLSNLYELAGESGADNLLDTRLVTASDRVADKAAALGFRHPPLMADGPGDEALVEALRRWRQAKRDPEPESATMTERAAQANEDTPAQEAGSMKQEARESAGEEPAPVPKTPQAKRRGGGVALLAILLSLAALAGSAYLWWELRLRDTQAAATLAAGDEAIRSVRDDMDRLAEQFDRSRSEVAGVTAIGSRLDASLRELRSSVETLGARVRRAEQSIDEARGVSAAARDNWVRAEAEYFLQTANSRLQLARDPDSALAALAAADDRLESLGDPGLYPVRQALATEIAALRSVPRPDVEGIAHTLNGLATRVDELPLDNATPESYATAATEPPPDGKPLDRAVSTVKGVLGSMISVKRTGEDATPLLSRDEEFFLKRNLELQLQTARLALLRGDAANYRESLRTARDWIDTHFVTDAPAVSSAVATLVELEAVDIAPSLPDISGSLRLLRRAAPAEDAA